jgi:hypothetical protein
MDQQIIKAVQIVESQVKNFSIKSFHLWIFININIIFKIFKKG